MKLLRKVVLGSGGTPAPDAIRAWQDHPVTERIFNLMFRLKNLGVTAEEQCGFEACRSTILDMFLDAEELILPSAMQALPEPDYGGDRILDARAEVLGLTKQEK